MAFLVGQNSAGFDTEQLVWGSSGQIGYFYNGYTASVSGTATTCYLDVPSWNSGSAAKVCVYNASYALLGTATFTNVGGTGVIASAFASSFAVVSGQQYYLAFVPDGYAYVRVASAGGTYACYRSNTGGYYATPPSTLPTGANVTNVSIKEFYVYVDGTTSINSGRNLLMGVG